MYQGGEIMVNDTFGGWGGMGEGVKIGRQERRAGRNDGKGGAAGRARP